MLRCRTLNDKINHIHERALGTVHSDYKSSFYEPLDKDSSFTIPQKNVQSLAIGIYEYLDVLYLAMLSEVFKVNVTIPYDLRMRNELYARNPKTVIYGPTAHVVYAKHFCNMLALYSSTAVLSSQFLVCLKFMYLSIFILHITSKNYSYMTYLGIFFNFQNL